jgi:hypothetical protein
MQTVSLVVFIAFVLFYLSRVFILAKRLCSNWDGVPVEDGTSEINWR